MDRWEDRERDFTEVEKKNLYRVWCYFDKRRGWKRNEAERSGWMEVEWSEAGTGVGCARGHNGSSFLPSQL